MSNLREFNVDSLSYNQVGPTTSSPSKDQDSKSNIRESSNQISASKSTRNNFVSNLPYIPIKKTVTQKAPRINPNKQPLEKLWKNWKQELVEKTNLPDSGKAFTKTLTPTTVVRKDNNIEQKQVSITTNNKSVSSEATGTWIDDLAIEERQMEEQGVVDYSHHFQKHKLIQNQTFEFQKKIHLKLTMLIEKFNEIRHSPQNSIKIYGISGSDNDFMLFRNGVKLVISSQQAGKIQFTFNQYIGQTFSSNSSRPLFIEASWGAFEQLVWNYKGERVNIDETVRFFLAEFVRQSAR